MIKIRRATEFETELFPDENNNWVIEDTRRKTLELVSTFQTAVRYCLWHIGVPTELAFRSSGKPSKQAAKCHNLRSISRKERRQNTQDGLAIYM